MSMARRITIGILVVVLLGMAYLLYLNSPPRHEDGDGCGVQGDAHEHADFRVYLDGAAYDFNQTKYMDHDEARLHLHDDIGAVLHKHWTGGTWGEFFADEGMELNDTCFSLDNGAQYCNDEARGKTLKMFVNGTRIEGNFASTEPMDLDRVLFSYGNESEEGISAQLASVGDLACLFSDRCPERGWPPGTENVQCGV